MLMIQIAVPPDIVGGKNESVVREFVLTSLRAAGELAEEDLKKRKITFSKHDYDNIVEQLETNPAADEMKDVPRQGDGCV